MPNSGDGWRLALPAASGAVMVLGSPPISIPIVPFIGLVPLLYWMSRPLRARDVLLGGWAFALPYFLGHTWWLFVLVRFTPAALPGAVGAMLMQITTFFLFPIVLNLLSHTRRLPLALTAPFVWVVSEHARCYGDFAFPFVTLGHSLSGWPLLIQHADIVGVYGISWWLVFVNALVATSLHERRNRRFVVVSLASLAALVLPLAYGAVRWESVEAQLAQAPTLRIGVIQPNIAQDLKWDPDAIPGIFEKVNRMIASAEALRPDLVVAPEACLPVIASAETKRLPAEISPGGAPLLIGVIAGLGQGVERQWKDRTITFYERHHNSAFLATPERAVVGRHDKQYLVPITEQVPYHIVFGFLLPFWNKQFGRFDPGSGLRPLELPASGVNGPVRFGVLICYESMFPSLVRRLRTMGSSFMVNMTNDAWFGRTNFPYMHAGICAVRAIENRCSIVRSANTGVSAFYDPLGRSLRTTGLFEDAMMVENVPLLEERTFYTRVGDAALWLSYVATGIFVLAAWHAFKRP